MVLSDSLRSLPTTSLESIRINEMEVWSPRPGFLLSRQDLTILQKDLGLIEALASQLVHQFGAVVTQGDELFPITNWRTFTRDLTIAFLVIDLQDPYEEPILLSGSIIGTAQVPPCWTITCCGVEEVDERLKPVAIATLEIWEGKATAQLDMPYQYPFRYGDLLL